MANPIYGILTLQALPHHWYTIGATASIALMGVLCAIFLTKTKRWLWLWQEWLTSTDPKKIGTMYMIFATLMFFRGLIDVAMMWLQQSLAADSAGYLTPDHFQQIFTAHGDIMVFFVTMGFFFGLMNWILPLQIGARDLAFPFMNSLGFWLTAAGGLMINLFFVIGGDFANTGWLAIAPLSEIEFNPGVGVDYLIWSLQLSGTGKSACRDQFYRDDNKKAGAGHDFDENAPFYLDLFMCDGSYHLFISGAHCNNPASLAGSVLWHALLHNRLWRQSDDVF